MDQPWHLPRPFEPDISLAVVSFGDELKTGAMTTSEFLDAAVRLGFTAVELCDRSVREPAAVAAGLADRGLRMPSIALRNDFTGNRSSTQASVDHLRRWLDLSAEFGCRTARIWTGWAATDGAARQQILWALDQVVPYAESVGVAVALETHGGLSNEPDFLRDLCERYSRSVFGVCLDFGNLPAARRRPLIADIAPLTTHVHVKSYAFDDRGNETTIPLAWAVATVGETGFAGQWVIEYEGPPPYPAGIHQTVATLHDSLGRAPLSLGALR